MDSMRTPEDSGVTPEEHSMLTMPSFDRKKIESMTGDECLDAIRHRYHLEEPDILKKPPAQNPDSLWNRNERARLALFYLELIPISEIASYYTVQFAQLTRNSDYALTNITVSTLLYQHMSQKVKGLVRAKRAHLRTIKAIAMNDPEIDRIFREIETFTGLSRSKLLGMKRIRGGGIFNQRQIAQAFLLRIRDNLPIAEILQRIRVYAEEGERTKRPNLLAKQINHMFSSEARSFLPKLKARRTL